MYHTTIHFEMPAENVETFRKFYSQLFGWKIEKTEGPEDYRLIETVPVYEHSKLKGPGINGAMMKKQNPEHKFTYYVLVESVDEYTKKIEQLRGKVTVPKIEVPNVGWWAMAVDPEGNHLPILEEMQK